jgi:hypothetical protein
MDNFEGRYSADAHTALVKSAADSNMNTLRVWGGGIFLPEAFYEAADRYGVLLFHVRPFRCHLKRSIRPSSCAATVEVDLDVLMVAVEQDMMFTTTSKTHEPSGSTEEAAELQVRIALPATGRVLLCMMFTKTLSCLLTAFSERHPSTCTSPINRSLELVQRMLGGWLVCQLRHDTSRRGGCVTSDLARLSVKGLEDGCTSPDGTPERSISDIGSKHGGRHAGIRQWYY